MKYIFIKHFKRRTSLHTHTVYDVKSMECKEVCSLWCVFDKIKRVLARCVYI